MNAFPLLLWLCLLSAYSALRLKRSSPQDGCPRMDPSSINVHVIAHTHMDLGWLKTAQQYFWGTRNEIQVANVQNIIDSVVEALESNPERKFMFVEASFLWMWWTHRDSSWHRRFRRLVKRGSLHLVGGGWVMNDEACTHYQGIIDQLTWGHRRLSDMMKGHWSPPKIAWQIDPFGHSREHASLLSQMAFDALFLNRIHFLDYRQRQQDSSLEFVWKTSEHLPSSHLFTSVFDGYCYPAEELNFDSGNNVVVDDPRSEEYNLDMYMDVLRNLAKRLSQGEKSDVILTFGQDFSFQAAHMVFGNMDKLIAGVNRLMRSNRTEKVALNMFYSTPACYLSTVYEKSKVYSVKKDDFFPYISSYTGAWTGFYTSRPALKLYERVSNQLLQSCKKLQVFAGLNSAAMDEKVAELREAVAMMQHHDAVTGTEQQHVARDYALQLSKGASSCLQVVEKAVAHFMGAPLGSRAKVNLCPLLNVSICPIVEENARFFVLLDNSLAWSRGKFFLRLPWADHDARVIGPRGERLHSQVMPIAEGFLDLPERGESEIQNELVIRVPELPGLTLSGILVERLALSTKVVEELTLLTSLTVASKSFNVTFGSSGSIEAVTMDGLWLKLKQEFMFYESGGIGQHGAYCFSASGEATSVRGKPEVTFIRGKFFTEVQQIITPWISQVVRVYEDDDLIEFDYRVGPLPAKEDGMEVITRYSSDLKNHGVFYTDANGRQMMKRIQNFYGTDKNSHIKDESISANYYPVTSRISIQDREKNLQLTVFTDRSQGGSSLSDGSVELMLHRRLFTDDNFGVNEPLNEEGVGGKGLVIRGKHHVLLSSIDDSTRHREKAIKLHLPPVPYFIPLDEEFGEEEEPGSLEGFAFSFSRKNLPPSVHLLTLESWKEGSILIRLEHIYQSTNVSDSLEPVTVDLGDLFRHLQVHSASEMTLSASQLFSDSWRLNWQSVEPTSQEWPFRPIDGLRVTLTPMQIRTFILNWPDSSTHRR